MSNAISPFTPRILHESNRTISQPEEFQKASELRFASFAASVGSAEKKTNFACAGKLFSTLFRVGIFHVMPTPRIRLDHLIFN